MNALLAVVVLAACSPSEDPHTVELNSSAMESAIRDGAVLTVDPGAYDTASVERFDIILYRQTAQDGSVSEYVHRVLGLEGEAFAYNGFDHLVIFDQQVDQPLTVKRPTDWIGQLTIPEGHVFVMGDNRSASLDEDSRTFGPIDESDVIGKVISFGSRDWVGRTGGTISALVGA